MKYFHSFLLIWVVSLSATADNALNSSLPEFSERSPIYINTEIVTDADNVIGIAPPGSPAMDQNNSSDKRGLEKVLYNGKTGLANWYPLVVRITNLTKNKKLYIDQITIEVVNYEGLIDGKYIRVFDIYTGSFERAYNFYEAAINKDQSHVDVMQATPDQNGKGYKKAYFEVPPEDTERFFISIYGKDEGSYDFRIKVAYSVNGITNSVYVDKMFRLTVLPGGVSRGGVWVRMDRMDEVIRTLTIQIAALQNKENAQAILNKLTSKNYEAYIVQEKGYYKVRIGAFQDNYSVNIVMRELQQVTGLAPMALAVDQDSIPKKILCGDNC